MNCHVLTRPARGAFFAAALFASHTRAADPAAPPPAPVDLRAQLQQALFEEEATRDLEKAAAGYEALLTQWGEQRRYAAAALFRLAEVRRKQNRREDSIKLYQRLLSQFADIDPQAKLSRENLAALGVKEPPPAAPAVPPDPEEEKELARLMTLAENNPAHLLDPVPPPGSNEVTTGVLARAAGRGWQRVAAWLLDHGADPNLSYNSTPLMSAAEKGQTAMCDLLFARGATAKSARGVLAKAISENFRDIIELLISKRVDFNETGYISLEPARNRRMVDATPLVAAIARGNYVLAERLLALKVDVNGPRMDTTALHLACWKKNAALVRRLLELGAKPDVLDTLGDEATSEYLDPGKGWAPLHIAANDPACVEALLKGGAKADVKDGEGLTPLHRACYFHNEASVRLLLAAGADPNATGALRGKLEPFPAFTSGGAALHFAAVVNKPGALVETLLKAGAKPDLRNKEGMSALHLAAGSSNLPAVEALLKAGANTGLLDNEKMTALHRAASSSSAPIVEALLKAGAKAGIFDGQGMTALHRAVAASNVPILEAMLKAGVPADVPDNSDSTALSKALQMERGKENRGYYVSADSRPVPVPAPDSDLAAMKKAGEMVDLLLKYGADPEKPWMENKKVYQAGSPARRGAIMRERIYPKLTGDAIHLGYPETGSVDALALKPKEGAAPPPPLAELLVTCGEPERTSGRSFGYNDFSVWRKKAEGGLERLAVDITAEGPLPELKWGDVIEGVVNEEKTMSPGAPDPLTALRLHSIRKVTVQMGNLRQELTLRGKLTVYDPSQAEAPLLSVTALALLLGANDPDFAGATVEVKHSGARGGEVLSWPVVSRVSALPEDGDMITVKPGEPAMAGTARKLSYSLTVPGKMGAWNYALAESRPTLAQFLAEVYAPLPEVALMAGTGQTNRAEIAEKISRMTPAELAAKAWQSAVYFPNRTVIAWPDWSGVKVRRLKDGGEEIIPVDLAAVMANLKPDGLPEQAMMPLQPGDRVELPVLREHPPGPWPGFDAAAVRFFQRALQAKMTLLEPNGQLREVTAEWLPPRWVDTPAGLLAVPDGVLSMGKVRSMRVWQVIESAAPEMQISSMTRDGKSVADTKEVPIAGYFVRPGDAIYLKNKPAAAPPPAAPSPSRRRVVLPHQ